VRSSHSGKGDAADDTHGQGGSVAVWVDCEIARLGVNVLGSVVCHCDYWAVVSAVCSNRRLNWGWVWGEQW